MRPGLVLTLKSGGLADLGSQHAAVFMATAVHLTSRSQASLTRQSFTFLGPFCLRPSRTPSDLDLLVLILLAEQGDEENCPDSTNSDSVSLLSQSGCLN